LSPGSSQIRSQLNQGQSRSTSRRPQDRVVQRNAQWEPHLNCNAWKHANALHVGAVRIVRLAECGRAPGCEEDAAHLRVLSEHGSKESAVPAPTSTIMPNRPKIERVEQCLIRPVLRAEGGFTGDTACMQGRRLELPPVTIVGVRPVSRRSVGESAGSSSRAIRG
jgi:hypothetical protein